MKTSEKMHQIIAIALSATTNFISYCKRVFEKIFILLKHLNESQSKIYSFILAVLIFTLMLFYTFQRAYNPFVHDSLFYWQFADSFSIDSFSFTNFSDGLRGYLFPFLLFLVKTQANLVSVDAKLLFYGYSSLFFTLLSIYIIPWAFGHIFRWKTFLFGRLLISIFIFYFWRGHFLYPLSDFLAFTALLIGVALLAKSLSYKTVSYHSVFIGLFIGAALNIRPVYLVSLIVMLPFLFLHVYKLGIPKGLKWFFLVLLGFSLVLLPQFLVNKTHFQVNSPLVLARVVGEENLYEKQLFWGLKTQKYEANIGDNYHSIIVVYNDPIFLKLQKTNLLREKDFARYFKIIKRFPLDMSLSYFRHTFNGLDIFYSTPYVKNVYADHTVFSVINYTIWFLLAYYFLRMDLTKLDHIKILGITCFVSPVIVAIPTAVEVRYFLAVYLLAYGVVAFDFDFVGSLKSLLRTPWNLLRLLIIYTFWVLICFIMSTATIENLI